MLIKENEVHSCRSRPTITWIKCLLAFFQLGKKKAKNSFILAKLQLRLMWLWSKKDFALSNCLVLDSSLVMWVFLLLGILYLHSCLCQWISVRLPHIYIYTSIFFYKINSQNHPNIYLQKIPDIQSLSFLWKGDMGWFSPVVLRLSVNFEFMFQSWQCYLGYMWCLKLRWKS